MTFQLAPHTRGADSFAHPGCGGGNALQLRTPHERCGYNHFIVKHMLFDRNFRMIGERSFDPDKDWPVSVYDITGLDKALYGVSVCNLHDTWMSALKL